MSVATVPGAKALTRMPSFAHSAAMLRVNASSAAFAPEYMLMLGA
jgi:hypothetical protein